MTRQAANAASKAALTSSFRRRREGGRGRIFIFFGDGSFSALVEVVMMSSSSMDPPRMEFRAVAERERILKKLRRRREFVKENEDVPELSLRRKSMR